MFIISGGWKGVRVPALPYSGKACACHGIFAFVFLSFVACVHCVAVQALLSRGLLFEVSFSVKMPYQDGPVGGSKCGWGGQGGSIFESGAGGEKEPFTKG